MLKNYRKKPVVVQAMQFLDTKTGMDIIAWVKEWGEITGNQVIDLQGHPLPCLLVKTLEGTMQANIGDWIIKGVKGEVYPCKPDIFAETYDEATTTAEVPQ